MSGKKRTLLWLSGVLAVMIALVAISPELYRTFCSLKQKHWIFLKYLPTWSGVTL